MGPLEPYVVEETKYSWKYPASNVLTLGDTDVNINGKPANYWLAEQNEDEGQHFIVKVDPCPRSIAGFQIKNLGEGGRGLRASRGFRVSGSLSKNGTWKTLKEDELVDTTGRKPAPLLNFTFEDPVEIQFLKFDLVSFWGKKGGGLQYFAPILATSKQFIMKCLRKKK